MKGKKVSEKNEVFLFFLKKIAKKGIFLRFFIIINGNFIYSSSFCMDLVKITNQNECSPKIWMSVF
jgi:hypothetical protein